MMNLLIFAELGTATLHELVGCTECHETYPGHVVSIVNGTRPSSAQPTS
jgi:hypothetical protein